jgi:hypothetical protein
MKFYATLALTLWVVVTGAILMVAIVDALCR